MGSEQIGGLLHQKYSVYSARSNEVGFGDVLWEESPIQSDEFVHRDH